MQGYGAVRVKHFVSILAGALVHTAIRKTFTVGRPQRLALAVTDQAVLILK